MSLGNLSALLIDSFAGLAYASLSIIARAITPWA
jgi:hypothetical protein